MEWNKEKLNELPEENRQRLEAAIKKYNEYKWWESKDLIIVAKYQLFEEVLMVDFSDFHEGVELLLGRPVFTHEFGINMDGLKNEAKKAITMLENGESLETSQQYKDKMTEKSIEQLEDFCKNNEKELYVIV